MDRSRPGARSDWEFTRSFWGCWDARNRSALPRNRPLRTTLSFRAIGTIPNPQFDDRVLASGSDLISGACAHTSMSLPIILAIVLTAAILAWGAVYLVVRHRREVALRKMFQADPMDAEIGREALRRVFGILADEDPPTPLPVPAPQPR